MSINFNDTFDGANGSAIDSNRWTITGSADIQNNMAELVAGEILVSKTTFAGDFDIQVDFALQSPPATNSWGVDLSATIDGTHYITSRATYNSGGKKWMIEYCNGGSPFYPGYTRTNDYGKLRIIRLGNTLIPYTADGAEGWTQRSSYTIGSVGNTVTIKLQVVNWDTLPAITNRFDNFFLNSGWPSNASIGSKEAWRLNVTAVNGSNKAQVDEITMVQGGVDQCTTVNSFASSSFGLSNLPSNAFYGSVGSVWASTDVASQIGWIFPSSKEISTYTLRAASTTEIPKNWTFEYWDGSKWVVADTQTNQTGWTSGEVRTYNVPIPVTGGPLIFIM